MVQLVHRDQAGFIPTRNTATNVRRLLRIMGEGQHATPSAAILSVDIEKALDILERPYLFSVLRQFGLGWTRVLYISAKTGAVISSSCLVGRGTRQGCLLSPFLFALAIEPLAIHARLGQRYTGLDFRGDEQHISLYAGDLLIFLANTGEALEGATALLHDFGRVSRLKVNWSKTCLFPVMATNNGATRARDIRWESSCLPYLGTNISLNKGSPGGEHR